MTCESQDKLLIHSFSVYRTYYLIEPDGAYERLHASLEEAHQLHGQQKGLGEEGIDHPLFVFSYQGRLWLKQGEERALVVPEPAEVQLRAFGAKGEHIRNLVIHTDPPIEWRYRSLWPETPELARWDENVWDVDLGAWLRVNLPDEQNLRYFADVWDTPGPAPGLEQP